MNQTDFKYNITGATQAIMTQSIENDIKSILGYKEKIDELKKKIKTEIKNQGVSDFAMVIIENQLNYLLLPKWEQEYLRGKS